MKIGEKIKKLRTEKSMTQSELAGGFITRNMLSLIESGSAQPSLPTIQYLAERLNVPAGILIAEDRYEYFYRRTSAIENIRRAFSAENYRICLDLCESLEDGNFDSEIELIKAECHLGIAKEAFSMGFLKNACANLDCACEMAEKTMYNTPHIFAEAMVYGNYMKAISPSFFTDCANNGSLAEMSFSDEFCRYAASLENISAGGCIYNFKNDIFNEHLKARQHMARGDHKFAYDQLLLILYTDSTLPKPLLYDVFRDLEVCCREIGDFKGAYEYSGAKVDLLEKFLSDEYLQ